MRHTPPTIKPSHKPQAMEQIMRNILSIGVAAGLAALFAGGIATAQTGAADNGTDKSRAGGKSIAEIVTKLERQGYQVRGIELDDGVYEVKAIDSKGMRVEADFDPATGNTVRDWRQDD